jgi:hypothetical protein
VEYLDYPLVALMPLQANGGWPQLVVQAARELPDASNTSNIAWFGELSMCLDDGDQVLVVVLPCLHVCSVAFSLGLMPSFREHAMVAAAEQQWWLLLQRLWAQMLVP